MSKNTISEDQGDINSSQQRQLFYEKLDEQTHFWLEDDAKYFLHQALSLSLIHI